jgi:hypothetical protein
MFTSPSCLSWGKLVKPLLGRGVVEGASFDGEETEGGRRAEDGCRRRLLVVDELELPKTGVRLDATCSLGCLQWSKIL